MTRCPICKTLIQPSEPTESCAECLSRYHEECWTHNGGCATYGCKLAAVPEKLVMEGPIGRGWGDEKSCPNCRRSIASSLMICKCGARFPWADSMTAEEYGAWLEEERTRADSRKFLTILFVLSLSGLLAPFTGTLAGVQAYRQRKILAGESGAFLALGYGAATIGAVYSLIFLLFYLGL